MVKDVYFIVLPEGQDASIKKTKPPTLNDDDRCIIYIQDGIDEDDNYLGTYPVSDGSGAKLFGSKYKVNSIKSDCSEFLDDAYEEISKYTGECKFCFMKPIDSLRDMLACIERKLDLSTTFNRTEEDGFSFIKECLNNDGYVMASLLGADDKLLGMTKVSVDVDTQQPAMKKRKIEKSTALESQIIVTKQPPPSNPAKSSSTSSQPPATKTPAKSSAMSSTAASSQSSSSQNSDVVNLDETDPQKIADMISLLEQKIEYQGFKPSLTRRVVYDSYKSLGKDIFARELMLILVCYCTIGNNVSKLVTKRVDVDIGRKVMQRIEQHRIVKKAQDQKSLTLPRIAIAFMPELFIIRSYICEKLQSQTSSSIDVKYQDLSFSGCPDINQLTGYDTFNLEMSAMIYKAGQEVDIKDEKFLKDHMRWNKVSIKGYSSDKHMKKRMNMAIASANWDRSQAYNFICSAFDDKDYVDSP